MALCKTLHRGRPRGGTPDVTKGHWDSTPQSHYEKRDEISKMVIIKRGDDRCGPLEKCAVCTSVTEVRSET